jgi:predicted metal-dependent hydrolase
MKEYIIKYEDDIVKCKIDRAKRKNVYIIVKNKEVIIKVPTILNDYDVKKIVDDKKDWIYKKIKNSIIKKQKEYVNNEKFYILGKIYDLKISYDYIKKSNVILKDNNLIVILPIKYCKFKEDDIKSKVKKLIDKLYYDITEEKVKEKIYNITKNVSLYPKEVRIKKLKRAWGICSSKKNITINSRLCMYSDDVIEYVLLHEVCHLKYMNHSKDFWNMINYYMPNYSIVRKYLKQTNYDIE